MYVMCICYNSHIDTLTAFMVRRTFRRRRNVRRRPISRFRRRPMRSRRRGIRATRRFKRKVRGGEKMHFKTRQLIIDANINSSSDTDGIWPVAFGEFFQPWTYFELRPWFQLFEFFRVNMVVITLTPNRTVNSSWYTGSTAMSSAIPVLHWCKDRDNVSTFPDSLDGLRYIQSRSTYRSALFDKPISLKCRPNVLAPTFLQALSQGVMNPVPSVGTPRFRQWISTRVFQLPLSSEADMQFFGIRGVFTFPPVSAGNQTYWPYQVSAKMYISFKSKRYQGDPS